MNCLSGAEHMYVTELACARPLPRRIETPKTAAEHASVTANRRLGLTGSIFVRGRTLRPSPLRDSPPRFTKPDNAEQQSRRVAGSGGTESGGRREPLLQEEVAHH